MSTDSELDLDRIENYRVVIIACSVFLMWLFNLMLLKVFGMNQQIYTESEINEMDKILTTKHQHSAPLHRMMTRSIDVDGKFRRRAMTNIIIIYGVTNFIMFCILIYIIMTNPLWIYNHFIENASSSVPYKPYQLFTCIGFSYFLFEMVYNHQYDYYEWNRTVSSHHWVAVFASLFAMNGYCLPFCTFYGINATILSFPSCFFIAWVFSEFSYKYPNLTRSIAGYIYYYHTTISLWNVTGTVYICVNSIKREAIEPTYIALFICIALVWIYDDIGTMNWLQFLTVHPYQDIQFYRSTVEKKVDKQSKTKTVNNRKSPNRKRKNKSM